MSEAARSGTPLFVVAGGAADSASDESLERLSLALHRADRRFRILKAERQTELRRLAHRAALLARRCRGVLVAAGGDATLNAVAREAIEVDRPVGLLPLGDCNYFARTHDLPSDPDEAVAVWVQGHEEPVPVGHVNGHPFLINASLGRYPEVLEAREGEDRAHLVWSALRTLLSWRSVMRIVTASEQSIAQIWAPTLLVCNNAPQLARLGLADAAGIGRGHLAAVCVAPLSVWRLMAVAARAAFGRKAPVQEVSSEEFSRMTVAPAGRRSRMRTVEVTCDGEVHALQAPLHFSVSPQALRLLKSRHRAPA